MISCFTSFAHLVEARSFYYSPAVRPFFTLFSVRHSDKPDTHPFPPIYYRTKRPAPCVSLVGRYQGPGAPLSTCQVALLALSTLDSHSISSYYSAYSTPLVTYVARPSLLLEKFLPLSLSLASQLLFCVGSKSPSNHSFPPHCITAGLLFRGRATTV